MGRGVFSQAILAYHMIIFYWKAGGPSISFYALTINLRDRPSHMGAGPGENSITHIVMTKFRPCANPGTKIR